MSIIAAVCKNDHIAVAADTMHSTGTRREHPDNLAGRSKLRRVGRNLIGGVGWSVYDNIFDHYLGKLSRPPRLNNERAIFEFFLKLWQTLRSKYQVVNDQPDRDDRSPFCDLDSEFIVVNRQGIFEVSSDLSVMRFERYLAIGSGDRYSYGALHTLYGSRRSAEQIAKQSVEAAVFFDQQCGGPVEVISVK